MGERGLSVWVVTCCLLSVGVAEGHGQQSVVADRMLRAADAANLEKADSAPWHMQMDVKLSDEKGANPTQGVIEVWHSGADERTTYTFGGVSNTKLRHEGKTYWSSTGTAASGAEEVLAEVLHAGPDSNDVTDSSPEVRKEKFGKVHLDCIMLGQPMKGNQEVPLGLFPTYCLNPGDDQIRITYEFGSRTVVVNQLGKFLEHEVPMQLVINEGSVAVASSKVTSLATYTPEPEEFTPTADMKEAGGLARISGGVVTGSRITFVQPRYPESAKMDHRSGVVVLHAIIGRDGHIRSLRPVNGADTDFTIAAIAAVRQWTYKPYLLLGQPTDVDTTITVNFALNR